MSDDLLKRLKSDYAGGYCNKRNIKAAIAVIEALQAENARLRAALTPFADDAPLWASYIAAEPLVEQWPGGVISGLCVGHLRSAEAALSATDPAPEAPDMTRPGDVEHET